MEIKRLFGDEFPNNNEIFIFALIARYCHCHVRFHIYIANGLVIQVTSTVKISQCRFKSPSFDSQAF